MITEEIKPEDIMAEEECEIVEITECPKFILLR